MDPGRTGRAGRGQDLGEEEGTEVEEEEEEEREGPEGVWDGRRKGRRGS